MNYFLAMFLLLFVVAAPASAQSLGSAFTYQGQLTESGQPATGLYDLRVCLFDSLAAGPSIACQELEDVPVEDGLFSVALDFGTTPFSGLSRYLELQVRPGDSAGGFTVLAPRQPVRATPEALRAESAADAASVPWAGIAGVPAGFADGVDDDSGGTVTSVTAGTGLTGGTITGSGIISVQPGGIGVAQIDTNEVQARVTDACPLGGYFEGVNADGSVTCGSAVTSLTAGTGLTGGTITDSGTIGIANGGVGAAQIDSTEVQARVTNTCPPGSYFGAINSDGSVACGGAVTSVTAGAGLTGGTITDSGSIGLAEGGVGATQINPAEVQARVTGVCPVGSYLRGINADGSVVCSELANQTKLQLVYGQNRSAGRFTSVAIGSDGLPVISFHDNQSSGLGVAKCHTPGCANATVSLIDYVGAVGTWTSITIGDDGLPVISYFDSTNNALKVAKCNDLACTGGDEIITTIDNSGNAGRYSSIAIGSDGLPVISYSGAITVGTILDYSLKVVKCNDAECTGRDESITTVDDAGSVGVSSSIAIGADGLPVVSYRDNTSGSLKIAKCNDPACSGGDESITAVDDPANAVGGYTSITIGVDGLPVISYQDFTAGVLKVAKCNDLACSGGDEMISTVDASSTDSGYWTSITIGVDGFPIISYHDAAFGTLKIAKCNDLACSGSDETIRTLDNSENDVGEYSSIAIDTDGLPVISYHDVTAGDLKVAKCGTQSCR